MITMITLMITMMITMIIMMITYRVNIQSNLKHYGIDTLMLKITLIITMKLEP